MPEVQHYQEKKCVTMADQFTAKSKCLYAHPKIVKHGISVVKGTIPRALSKQSVLITPSQHTYKHVELSTVAPSSLTQSTTLRCVPLPHVVEQSPQDPDTSFKS